MDLLENFEIIVDMYKKFRQELDSICVPDIILESTTKEIMYDEKLVGILIYSGNYIDCLYILPEYRRQGIAKKAVLDWYLSRKNFLGCPTLHIINNNLSAIFFWKSIFYLEVIESNPIDTLYKVLCPIEENIIYDKVSSFALDKNFKKVEYFPSCKFGYLDCIYDEEYLKISASEYLERLISCGGHPCKECIEGNCYDDENK